MNRNTVPIALASLLFLIFVEVFFPEYINKYDLTNYRLLSNQILRDILWYHTFLYIKNIFFILLFLIALIINTIIDNFLNYFPKKDYE